MRTLFALAFVAFLAGPAAGEPAQRVVDLPSRPGAGVQLLLVEPETKPHASVLLFNGGTGRIFLWRPSDTPLAQRYARGNFLLRTRALFAARGLRVGAIDVPADLRADGMPATFRHSAEHARDVAAAVAALRGPENLPVWLVGTSMGTVSAAAVAVTLGEGIDGLVLTSSMTRRVRAGINAIPEAGGIRDYALERVTVPVFALAHRDDSCFATPAADVADLARRFVRARRVGTWILAGGLPPESEPCEALAAHGFFGVEAEAVAAIADFIAASR